MMLAMVLIAGLVAGAASDLDYREGLSNLDGHNWSAAAAAFARSAARKGEAADAALYWKAYAEARAGARGAATQTIRLLRNDYAGSEWTWDARALELQLETASGKPPDPATEHDANLKLLALDGVMRANPGAALPALRTLLKGPGPTQVKAKALFVLAESGSAEARKLVREVAASSGTEPAVRMEAIRYVGMADGEDATKELLSLYRTTQDERTRQVIVQQLAMTGHADDVWQLYQAAGSKEQKAAILRMMFLAGKTDRLLQVARSTGTDVKLREAAIRSLGMMQEQGQSETLTEMYRTESSREIRAAIAQAMMLHGNGKALVALARNEKDPRLQEEIVRNLSMMPDKEVNDYLIELIK